jgi:hypothetical protein
LFPLGIEAGFEYCQKVVPVGPLICYNVAFSVSAQLPFQDRDARFRFALALVDAPFMISYPPYGGGGFFAITSNGREIVQAECSFEFGAVLGVAFGPLSAVARVMAWHVGYSLTDGWIVLSILLYIVTGCFWLPVVWMRMACGTWRKPRRAKAYRFHRRITACSGPGSRSAFPRLRPSSASCG